MRSGRQQSISSSLGRLVAGGNCAALCCSSLALSLDDQSLLCTFRMALGRRNVAGVSSCGSFGLR